MTDPVKKFRSLWLEARSKRDPTADYLFLATSDAKGDPHVRTVLIKTLDSRGVGFVTNISGPKVAQVKHRSRVECCLAWPSLALQVRLTGGAKKMPRNLLDALWEKRPREAKLLYSLGLKQSAVIPSYPYLKKKVAVLRKMWKNRKVIPRDPSYVGYFIDIRTIEFLHHSPTRLNKREHYRKSSKGWKKTILAP